MTANAPEASPALGLPARPKGDTADENEAGAAVDVANDVVSDVWGNAGEAGVDDDSSPTKVCRNARQFGFEGIAGDEDSGDLPAAWRSLLEREGKASPDGESLGRLVLGASAQQSRPD